MKTTIWSDGITGTAIGDFPDTWNDGYEYPDMLCPVCGARCQYCEGTIDQDRQGNDIDGCWWHCLTCNITSANEEL